MNLYSQLVKKLQPFLGSEIVDFGMSAAESGDLSSVKRCVSSGKVDVDAVHEIEFNEQKVGYRFALLIDCYTFYEYD